MTDVKTIEAQEVIKVMQQMFPKEYQICVQQVYISKLEAELENKQTD